MLTRSWLIVLVLGAASAARAYTIETHFTASCHERITAQALRAARLALELPRTPPSTADEQALIDDLQFAPDADMKDLAGATLLIGVRDNDLKGNSQEDLTVLSTVHGDPANQDEHCLRGPDQKEPDGTALAVGACRAFIRGRVLEAMAGLDAAGNPDFANRTSLGLYLSLRGHVDASLPTVYVRLGQALHAVQDSFTHTYRTPDGMQITVALNWLDEVNGSLVESRDGPGHASKLDACDDPDELRKTRRLLATAASTALMVAVLDARKTPAEKLAAAEGILDTYVAYAPGCTFANAWCDAPEARYKDSKSLFGCSTGGAAFGVLGLLALLLHRRRTAGAATLLIVLAGSARAQPAEPTASRTTKTTKATADKPAMVTVTTVTTAPAEDSVHLPPAPVIIPVAEPGPRDPSQTAWGAYFGSAGSLDKTAVAFQAGGRLKASTHWTFGVDAEWNPWIALNGYRVGSGVFNLYGAAILRFPLAYENFNLRATANLGASYLLMSLYGAPSGSLGVYAGISPAGLEWKLSRRFILVLNPLSIALPAPQLHGVPLTYPQYRFNIGFEIQSG